MPKSSELVKYMLDPDTNALHECDKDCKASGKQSFEVWLTEEVAEKRPICGRCAPEPEMTHEEFLVYMLSWSQDQQLTPEQTASVLIRNGSKLMASIGPMYSRMMYKRDKEAHGRPQKDFSPFLGFNLPPELSMGQSA